jgi:hypothetical protein
MVILDSRHRRTELLGCQNWNVTAEYPANSIERLEFVRKPPGSKSGLFHVMLSLLARQAGSAALTSRKALTNAQRIPREKLLRVKPLPSLALDFQQAQCLGTACDDDSALV